MAKELNISDLQLKYLELETLLDITNDLNSFEEIPVLLQEILVKSCAVLNASSGLILIEDENSNVLNIGADFNIDISALNGIIFNKNKGVIKEINQSRKTLCFKISQDNYFYGTNCVYCLIAPLLDKQKLAGAIVLSQEKEYLLL